MDLQDHQPDARTAIDDPLLSPRDICGALRISRTTLYRHVRAGKFPPPSIRFEAGSQAQTYRWRKSVVEEHLRSIEEAASGAPDAPAVPAVPAA